MPKCCVKGCGFNYSKNTPMISLHRFPKNKQRRAEWVEAIGIVNFNVKEHSAVCSAHFEDSSINRTLGVVRLKDEAVPSVFAERTSRATAKLKLGRPLNDQRLSTYVRDGASAPLSRNGNVTAPSKGTRGALLGNRSSQVDAMEDEFNICRTCLISDVKMYQLSQHGLEYKMEFVSGLKALDDWIPTQLCYQCAAIVNKFYLFKQKCIRAHNCLKEHLGKEAKKRELTNERVSLKLHSALGLSPISTLEIANIVSPTKVELPSEEDVLEDTIEDSGFQNEIVSGDEEAKEDLVTVVKIEEWELENEGGCEDIAELIDEECDQDEIPLNQLKLEPNSEPGSHRIEVKGVAEKVTDSRKRERRKYAKRKNVEAIKKPPPKRKLRSKLSLTPSNPKTKPSASSRWDCSSFSTEVMLSREEQLREVNDRCNSLNYINSPFKCLYCFKGFLEQVTYTNHMVKHDESRGEHVCDICRYRYNSRRRLRSHLMQHQRRLKCNKCDYVSSNRTQAITHNKWHEGVLYNCPHCNMSFSIRSTVVNHIREKHPSNHVCAQCGETFQSPHGLSMHRHRSHLALEKAAALAGKLGAPDGALDTPDSDKVSKEKGEERWCEECAVTFASGAAYDRHLVTSSNHAFKKKKKKALYRRTKPAIPGPVTCGICGKGYKTHDRYEYHVRTRHMEGAALGKKRHGVERSAFMCDVCGKRLTSKNILINHIRTHTGEKPFKCDKCDRAFRTKQQRDDHIVLRHTTEKRHECPTCKRRFNSVGNMTRHTAVHSELRPYACELCGKTFKTSGSIFCHRKNVHLKKKYNKADDSDSMNAAVAVSEGFKMATADLAVNRQAGHRFNMAAELSNYFRLKADFE